MVWDSGGIKILEDFNMDFTIDNVKTFLAAMLYIRMFGTLVDTTTGVSGYVSRTYVYGSKYTLYVYNRGGGLGMHFSIFKNKTVYRYYAVTDRDYIKILGLPDNKLKIEKY